MLSHLEYSQELRTEKLMTILDACEQVLKDAKSPLTADQIYDEIIKRKLYRFKARDPKSILRGTLRKHLRGDSRKRIVQTGGKLFEIA